MESSESPRRVRHLLIYGILFLFFFRLITDFVAAIYAFGLLSTSIPTEIVSVVFFFSPAFLLLRRKGLPAGVLVLFGGLVLIAGAAEAMLDTRGRMLVCGIGVGSTLVLLPSLLWEQARRRDEAGAAILGAGLALGLALAVLFRVWNSGVDPSSQGWHQGIGWVLAIIAAALLLLEISQGRDEANRAEPDQRPSFLVIAGLSLGMMAALMLLYFAFASPNVIARWTGASYPAILVVMMLALTLFALWITLIPRGLSSLAVGIVFLWNALFVISLVATILAHQLRFPAQPGGYPFYEPPVTSLHHLPLALMCALFPVILVDLALYSRELLALRPGMRSLGGAFALASLFCFLMILAQVCTTVYDYIPAIGPFFRDRFWAVFLVLGLALALPLLLLGRRDASPGKAALPRAFAGIMVVLGVAAVAGGWATSSRPPAPPQGRAMLKILTYNIQQGYSADGQENHVGQLELLRQVDADVIGLQESDTNRISGGNADIVRYFADALNLHAYYGPKVVPGTFGIALLSRYPLQNPRTFYMYSAGEQTAAISAQVVVEGRAFHLFVTHLGNGGPMVQQEALLKAVGNLPHAIAMGDYNFPPDSEQYRLTRRTLDDAWLLKWPQGVDDRGFDPVNRIDHIFLSPGAAVRDARYLAGPQSDHPALVVEVGW